MNGGIYRSDPDRAPDSHFLPGELRHLVVGNRGRLLDLRRTPVHVTRVLPGTGFFEIEIDAFEDAGVRWLVPLEEVTSYQFAAGGELAGGSAVRELRSAVARYDIKVTVTGGQAAREHTLDRLLAECSRAADWLNGAGAPVSFDPLPFAETASGWPEAGGWLDGYMAARGLADVEEEFSAAYVSNPWSGDIALAHLTVMAELGLGTLTARALRDPGCFEGAWARHCRAEHILARIGFVRALWARADRVMTLYRGIGLQKGTARLDGRSRSGQLPVTSASFSRRVAESHFGAPGAVSGALYREPLQPERLFMTFLETRAMSRQYSEAEAVLLTGTGTFF